MDLFVIGVYIFIFVIILFKFIPSIITNIHIRKVPASDGTVWNVQNDLPCPKCSANRLSDTNKDIIKLIKYVNEKYPNDPRSIRVKKYNINNVYEGRPDGSDTSYVINKGDKIVFCQRSAKDNSKFIEKNLQIYTMIHELAHIASQSYGHGMEFQINFLWLLKQAVDLGIYKPVDYSKHPIEFCGMTVDSSILY